MCNPSKHTYSMLWKRRTIMKKILSIILSGVCALGAGLCLTSCQKNETAYNAEYTFDKITFSKSDTLKIEDLSTFIPSISLSEPIGTIKEFEDFLCDNIDTYSIVRNNNGVNERISLAPKYHSIFVKTDEIIMVGIMKEGSVVYEEYTYTKKNYGGSIVYLTDNEIFTFSNNTMTYDFSFPLEPSNSFVVIYNYKH